MVNNYMGPVATKAMKGYSDEDLSDLDAFKVRSFIPFNPRLKSVVCYKFGLCLSFCLWSVKFMFFMLESG